MWWELYRKICASRAQFAKMRCSVLWTVLLSRIRTQTGPLSKTSRLSCERPLRGLLQEISLLRVVLRPGVKRWDTGGSGSGIISNDSPSEDGLQPGFAQQAGFKEPPGCVALAAANRVFLPRVQPHRHQFQIGNDVV